MHVKLGVRFNLYIRDEPQPIKLKTQESAEAALWVRSGRTMIATDCFFRFCEGVCAREPDIEWRVQARTPTSDSDPLMIGSLKCFCCYSPIDRTFNVCCSMCFFTAFSAFTFGFVWFFPETPSRSTSTPRPARPGWPSTPSWPSATKANP